MISPLSSHELSLGSPDLPSGYPPHIELGQLCVQLALMSRGLLEWSHVIVYVFSRNHLRGNEWGGGSAGATNQIARRPNLSLMHGTL